MGHESLNYITSIDLVDVKGDTLPDSENESRIKDFAKKYVEKRVKEGINKSDLDTLVKDIKVLLQRQDIEKINLQEAFEKSKSLIISDVKEKVGDESMITKLQMQIYTTLGINPELSFNSNIDKFKKGLIDGLILDNVELVKEILSGGVEKFLSMLKELLSLEGIKEFIKSIKDDVVNISDILRKPYEGGVSVGGLGLGIFGKGLKGLKLFGKIDKIDDVGGGIELGGLNKITPGKLDYRKVMDISTYEVDLIKNPSKNLNSVLKDFDPKEKFVVDRLNKMANTWIEARVGNINNMLDYMITHPGNLVEMKKVVIEDGVLELMGQIKNFSEKGMLGMDQPNMVKIKQMTEKILLIKKK